MVRKPELITPESLLEDNHSDESVYRRGEFKDIKARGGLLLASSCSDARVHITTFFGTWGTTRFTSIAAAGSTRALSRLTKEKGIGGVATISHKDGHAPFIHGKPAGCGGLSAHENIDKLPEGDAFKTYIGTIHSSDPTVQALHSGLIAARFTDKDVIPVVNDHRTGKMDPIGVITDGGRTVRFVQYLPEMLADNLSEIYERNGFQIPRMEVGDLPEFFIPFFEANERFVREVGSSEEFQDSQAVQNPFAVAITDGRRPHSIKYAGLFGDPNSIFTLRKSKEFDPQELAEIFAELWYPISHAAKATPGDPFSNTRTLIVETADIGMSREIAFQASEFPWMKEWVEKAGGNIIVGKVHNGDLLEAEYFKK